MISLYRITILGAGVNLALALLKILAGWWGHSQAVLADGVHSLSDLATDLLTLLGLKYGAAPPDEDHPYGHRRIETLLAVTVGVLLGATGLGLAFRALTSLHSRPPETLPLWVLLPPALSLLLKEGLFRLTLRIGKELGSPVVIANAHHHRSDALSSLPALVGAGGAALHPGLHFLDPLGSLLVSGFILRCAWRIVQPGVTELCDGIDVEEAQRIREEVLKVKGVKDAHRVRARKHAGRTLVDLHIQVDPHLSVREGHRISERVKRFLMARHRRIMDVVVHLEPYEKGPNPEASPSPGPREDEDGDERPSARP
ncbi:cation transporter [Thermosulfurimonas marina]|uniref:Cation transporter n=1 Tax=Thermosulfurimonas marina TaxID=2047767 RepID=A0A6H1WRQ1_9BACT|nr:cation diffusion facilitator family transporter [Thermosulfurimonas marina]QJA05816.1 cation transporter [Thermosulfurimonas marina]